jgi:hypothetical protein
VAARVLDPLSLDSRADRTWVPRREAAAAMSHANLPDAPQTRRGRWVFLDRDAIAYRWRNGEAERLGGLEVDDELELRSLLDGKIAGLCASQDLSTTSALRRYNSWTLTP